MSKIVTIFSKSNNVGATTFAFNLSQCIRNKNRRVLLIDLELTPTYLDIFKTKKLKLNTNNCMSTFYMSEFVKKVQLLFLTNGKVLVNKNDCVNLLAKQIESVKRYFDVILIDASSSWLSLTTKAVQMSDGLICLYNVNNLKDADILKSMQFIKIHNEKNAKKLFAINGYSNKNNTHIGTVLRLTKMVNKKYPIMTIPLNKQLENIDENTISFVEKNPWEEYTLTLVKIAERILK